MKRATVVFLTVLSIPFIFAGCKSGEMKDMASSVKSEVGSIIDKTESKISGAFTPKISRSEAKDIAIKHAGVTASEVRDMDIDLEYYNNTANYEIDFEVGSMEYDYHIDAETGEVLFFTKENKD